MSRLFDRVFEVVVSRPTGFFSQEPNVITIRALRVVFAVEKTLSPEPNTATVTITNLSAATRAEFETKPLHVRLLVGYDGATKQIAQGDVRFARSRHLSTEWETELQIADGDRAYRHARAGRSYGPGVNGKTVVKDLAGSMGLKIPSSVEDAKELYSQFANGVTTSGPSKNELTRVLGARGMGWSVQDGRLQILRANEAAEGTAFLISQDTGMIEVPEFGSPEKKGKPPSLTVKVLCYPEIAPGRKIQVKSARINGLFRAVKVNHDGDTSGSDWTTTIEASPL